MLRGSSQARTIRSRGTGSGWLARKRSTRSVRVAAGTWLMGASCHRPRGGPRGRCEGPGSGSRVRRRVPVLPGPSARCVPGFTAGSVLVPSGLVGCPCRWCRAGAAGGAAVPVVPCRWCRCRGGADVPVVPGRAGRARLGDRGAGRGRGGRVVVRAVVHVGVDPVGLAQRVLLAGLLHGVALPGLLRLVLGTLGLGALGCGLRPRPPGPGAGTRCRSGAWVAAAAAQLLGVGALLLGLALLA